MLPVVWLILGGITFAAAVRAARSPRARRAGRLAVGVLYIGAGALVNAAFLARGDDYEKFADGSYIHYVRDTWRSLVVPNHDVFISTLIVYELAVGVLVLSGGRRTQLGLVGALGFHVALLSFGWGFYLWSLPMLVALALLLRAERQSATSGPQTNPAEMARAA